MPVLEGHALCPEEQVLRGWGGERAGIRTQAPLLF